MSAPQSKAPPSGAQAGDTPTAPPAAAQIPAIPQGVSGNGVQTAGANTVPVPQGQHAPVTGAPGAGAQVSRQPAPMSRDTFNTRSLGPALNSQVKKVRGNLRSLSPPHISSLAGVTNARFLESPLYFVATRHGLVYFAHWPGIGLLLAARARASRDVIFRAISRQQ